MGKRPSSINFIGIYCFLLSFLLLLPAQWVMNKDIVNSEADLKAWGMGAMSWLVIVLLFFLGIGIFRLSRIAWRGLVIFLLFSLTSFVSLIATGLIFIIFSVIVNHSIFEFVDVRSEVWLAILFAYLSQTIVLYYLTSDEVRRAFDE